MQDHDNESSESRHPGLNRGPTDYESGNAARSNDSPSRKPSGSTEKSGSSPRPRHDGARLGRRATHPVPRFRNLYQPDTQTGCWLWIGGTAGGYSQFFNGKRRISGHRFAYEFFIGPIPDGMQIDHVCRARLCVNPSHLEPVSANENVRRGMKGDLRTHCHRGHPYSAETLAPLAASKGRRICLECREIEQAADARRLRDNALSVVKKARTDRTAIGPTERQMEILRYFAAEIEALRAPTIRDICIRFGLASTNGANDHIKALEKRGFLEREKQRARSIRVTAAGHVALSLAAETERKDPDRLVQLTVALREFGSDLDSIEGSEPTAVIADLRAAHSEVAE